MSNHPKKKCYPCPQPQPCPQPHPGPPNHTESSDDDCDRDSDRDSDRGEAGGREGCQVRGLLSTPTPITGTGIGTLGPQPGQHTALLSPCPPTFGTTGFQGAVTSRGWVLSYGEQNNYQVQCGQKCKPKCPELPSQWVSGYVLATFGPLTLQTEAFTSTDVPILELAVTVNGHPNPSVARQVIPVTTLGVGADQVKVLGPVTINLPLTLYLRSGDLVFPAFRLAFYNGTTTTYAPTPENFATAFTISVQA